MNGMEQLRLTPEEKPDNALRLGYEFGEVTSALQKEIRRGDEEAAVYWSLLLYEKAPFYVWKRVLVTAAEDVGLAAPEVVSQVYALSQGWASCKQKSFYVSPHALTMAVVLLCRAPKSTEIEDLQSLTLQQIKDGEKREMPTYALDGHTKAGKESGATWDQWYRDRHVTFGIPVNPYTRRLWARKPEWRPEGVE